MPANLENSAVATELEKVSIHSNPKERQHQRMLKRPHNCTHLTHQQSNAQNSPSQASTVRELRTSRFQAGFRKGRAQTANIDWIIEKAREFVGKGVHQGCMLSPCFFFPFIFIRWRLITLQYCSVFFFCHTLT